MEIIICFGKLIANNAIMHIKKIVINMKKRKKHTNY